MDNSSENKVYTDLKFAQSNAEYVYNLDLSNQHLQAIPNEIYEFANLRMLKLDNNQINSVIIKPNSLNNLEYLSISKNQLTEFTYPNNSLNFLKKLYLDQNKLNYFPINTGSNTIIEDLKLEFNHITEVPGAETFPTSLKYLYLDGNPLQNSEVIFQLGYNLEELSMYKTGLSNIPEDCYLGKLKKLKVGNNPLNFSTYKATYFPKLQYLDMSYVNLNHEIPFEELKQHKKLRYLSLEKCGLKSLSPDIGSMSKLKELTLLGNEIKELPDVFFELELDIINLEQNLLSGDSKDQIIKKWPRATVHL